MLTKEDLEFKASFFDQTLPKEKWTHTAHIHLAWILLVENSSFEAALILARDGIQKYNAKVGARTGYHETITRAYLMLICNRQNETGPSTFEDFQKNHADLFETKLGVLKKYYSDSVLWSEEARRDFVHPDLQTFSIYE